MSDILKRIHGVMRLLLLATVALAYPIYQTPPDVLELDRRTADGLGYVKDCWDPAKGFMNKDNAVRPYVLGLRSEDTPTSAEERRVLVGDIQIRSVTWLRLYLSKRELFNLSEACQNEWYEGPDIAGIISLFKNTIPELSRLYAESGLAETATFRELHQSLQQKVVVPVLGQTLDIEPAIKVVGTGAAVLLLYLYSLCYALRTTSDRYWTRIRSLWGLLTLAVMVLLKALGLRKVNSSNLELVTLSPGESNNANSVGAKSRAAD